MKADKTVLRLDERERKGKSKTKRKSKKFGKEEIKKNRKKKTD